MKKYTLMYCPAIIFMVLLGNGIASAQKIFKALPVNASYAETNALKKVFKRQTIVQLDAAAIYQYVKQAGSQSNIVIDAGNNYQWDIFLEPHDLRSPDYMLQRTTAKGLVTMAHEDLHTYAGYLKGSTGNYVRMNVQDMKLSGYISDHGRSVYIEPLKKFIPSAAADKYIIYKRGDSNPIQGYCNQVAPAEQQVNEKLSSLASPTTADCRIIEIATESDWENYVQGISAADIIGNLNFVEPLYQNYYGASIIVKYQHEWATPLDPYTATAICSDGGDRLNEFASYWQSNYTWVKRDVNILYSGVDFAGSTIGCAYVGVFNSTSDACYAVVQWKTGYTDEGREVLVAHEMGHIFGCSHDDIGCSSNNGPIMCPSINAACADNCVPYWSLASITSISGTMVSANGSSRLRTREFFQPVNTAFLLGLPYVASGNNVYVAAANVVTNSLLGNGFIVYSGTDNLTLQPGFSAVVANGTGTFTAQIGPCNVNSQFSPKTVETAALQAVPKKETITGDAVIKIYPNPFSSITNISIELTKTAHVSLTIYDLSGKLIDNPVKNKIMLQGNNTITYTNTGLTSNFYLFVVEIDGKRFIEKVIKMK